MNTPNARLVLAAALAILAAPVLGEEPPPLVLDDAPPALEQPLDSDDGAPLELDISGRLRATRDGFSLEVGGARLEFRVAGDQLPSGEPLGGSAPGAHDFRATFSLDGKVTNLLFRFVPPAGPEAQPAPK